MNGSSPGVSRRRFLSLGAMSVMLVLAYGTFLTFLARFLMPSSREKRLRPMFVTFSNQLPVGTSKPVTTPRGDRVILTNTGELQRNGKHSYLAFSSRCPHLGCKVHYDADQAVFVCPCHQGIFDRAGIATSGPPAQAGQRLAAYEVTTIGKGIYLMVEAGA